jgi:ABC-2 type transport system permease protein
MSKLPAIIRREFVERVRTKAFIIGTVLGPLIFLGMGLFITLIFGRDTGTSRLAILDAASGPLGARIEARLQADSLRTDGTAAPRYEVALVPAAGRLEAVRDSLVKLVDQRGSDGRPDADGLRGIVVVTDSAVAAGHLDYLGTNVGSFTDMGHLERLLHDVVAQERLRGAGVSDSVARIATAKFELNTAKITKGRLTGERGESAFWLAYVLVIILFVAMMPTGVQVMSAVVEEKSNRILEVLVSSVRPFELLLGKVVGVGAASLLQLGIWAGSALYVTGHFSRPPAGSLEASGAMSGAGGAAPVLPTIPPELVFVALAYFLLGFLLFAAIYAAVGAMCNSVQETQQFQMPVMLVAMLGYFGAFAAINNPGSSLARALSFVPPSAPFVVPVRYAMSPLPLPELLLSIACCVAGVLVVTWIAARIYRVGILSYGKRPGLREIARWIRSS